MFHTDIDHFSKQTLAGLLCWFFFGGAAASLVPIITPLYVAICVCMTWNSLKALYISERFIDVAKLVLLNALSICPLLSFLIGIALFDRMLKLWTPYAFALSLAPATLVIAGYWIARRSSAAKSPFHISNGRVSYHPTPPNTRVGALAAGVFASLSASATSAFGAESQQTMAVGIYIFLTFIGPWYVFHMRHAIAGLQELKSDEFSIGRQLIFQNIEAIRELRRRSWLAKRIGGLLSKGTRTR